MRIAVFSDVHGNLAALKAVLEKIKTQKPDRVICAGDLVGYAPFPNEVIDLVRSEGIPSVMGNYDDGVGNDRPECGCAYKDEEAEALGQQSLNWTKAHTTTANKEFLRGLPNHISFPAGKYRVMVVHGSPRRINEYLFAEKPEATLKRVLESSHSDILVCGHTHIPYHKIIDGKHLINAGSVGKPKHGDPDAVYAVLEVDESADAGTTEANSVRVDFVKVPYPVEETAQAIEKSGLPPAFAHLLREGKG
ncbi:MAG: metallophosphoesterase family protein [Syntrophothermus sp.]